MDYTKPVAEGKKRIVIAWNEHPTESAIAGLHARRVANILQHKYGDLYEIIVHKIPFKKTNLGIVRDEKDIKSKRKALNELQESKAIALELAKYYSADKCYNFHTTPFKNLRVNPKKDPETYGTYTFRGGEFDFAAHNFRIELQFYPSHNNQGVLVEMPAEYAPQPKRLIARYKKTKNKIRPNFFLSLLTGKNYGIEYALQKHYQDETTKLKLPFSHPAISRKIAEEIHRQM